MIFKISLFKRAIDSQLSMTEYKQTNKQTKKMKQTTRTGTESQVWRSFGGLSARREKGEEGEKGQGLKSIIGRYKIDRGWLRIVQEMEKPNNLYP